MKTNTLGKTAIAQKRFSLARISPLFPFQQQDIKDWDRRTLYPQSSPLQFIPNFLPSLTLTWSVQIINIVVSSRFLFFFLKAINLRSSFSLYLQIQAKLNSFCSCGPLRRVLFCLVEMTSHFNIRPKVFSSSQILFRTPNLITSASPSLSPFPPQQTGSASLQPTPNNQSCNQPTYQQSRVVLLPGKEKEKRNSLKERMCQMLYTFTSLITQSFLTRD